MSEEEAPTPTKGKPDYYNLMKFKLHQVVLYKDQQYSILGWSTNGDGDRNSKNDSVDGDGSGGGDDENGCGYNYS